MPPARLRRNSIKVTFILISVNWTRRKAVSIAPRPCGYGSATNENRQSLTVAKGRLEVRRGNYQAALNHFQEALTSLEPMGDAVWEGSSLTGIAQVYEEMGEVGPALKHRERALQLYETAGLKIFAVGVLRNLGATYLASGDHARALNHFERVLALADELRIERWKAWALRYIGLVHLVRQQPDQARQSFDRAVEVQRRVGDPRLERQLRTNIGKVLDLQGQHDVAINHLEEALALSRNTGDRVTEASALVRPRPSLRSVQTISIGRVVYIDRALSVAESLRSGVENRNLRASYVASVYGLYKLQVNVLARLSKVRPGEGLSAKAFEASERARARSLLDSLTESDVDLRAGVDADLPPPRTASEAGVRRLGKAKPRIRR